MFVKNTWYVAAWADEVESRPLARTLLNEPIELAKATLFAAEQELNDDEADSALIPVCFGAASLPEEGSDPTALLVLADERLRLRMSSRKPRERCRLDP